MLRARDIDQRNVRADGSLANVIFPAIVLVYMPTCGHCKPVIPELDVVAKQVGEVIGVYKLDATKNPKAWDVKSWSVQGVPTLLFFDNAKSRGQPYDGDRTATAMMTRVCSGRSFKHCTMPSARPREIGDAWRTPLEFAEWNDR
jgi:hypothetical protein